MSEYTLETALADTLAGLVATPCFARMDDAAKRETLAGEIVLALKPTRDGFDELSEMVKQQGDRAAAAERIVTFFRSNPSMPYRDIPEGIKRELGIA